MAKNEAENETSAKEGRRSDAAALVQKIIANMEKVIIGKRPPPFLIIATQNPIDHEGTFPLPEAQLDRFLIRLALGYPTIEEEGKMLTRMQRGHPIDDLGAVVQAADIIAGQEAVREVHVDDKVRRYILELVKATRENEDMLLGGS